MWRSGRPLSSGMILERSAPCMRFQKRIRKVNAILQNTIPLLPNTEFVDAEKGFLDANGEIDPRYYRPDMCHLCRKGYMVWYAAIKDILAKYL